VAPERIVELASYHAILGCAVAGMGVALMPRSVLDTYTERSRLSVHALNGRFRAARTLLIWRKEAPQAKVAAFADILIPRREKTRKKPANVRRERQNS
jgi:DNA-binding transcriptional LysR family regulator